MAVLHESTEERVARTIAERGLAGPATPVLLMVSGGSDSTAMAYLVSDLAAAGAVGPVGVLHVNHKLRGGDADADAAFVESLAAALGAPFFLANVDVTRLVRESGDNLEAVARRERYHAADEALEKLCLQAGAPVCEGRIFVAHTQDDRVENFYMRSIVGTGPGGFRSMRYANGNVARPCLDVGRGDLRDYLRRRAIDAAADASVPLARDAEGALWREDATNAHTDRFRAFVRHEIVPRAKERNPRLLDTLTRTMNLIADEDDMLELQAAAAVGEHVEWVSRAEPPVWAEGCVFLPSFGTVPVPLARRAVDRVLARMLPPAARVEAASVDAVVRAFAGGAPIGGYTANIQGDLAISANKRGVRLEPMAAYRARRNRL
ncbi:MAG: tRNA lysidine(34) synthetase TilS [Eggerthellaceae bacterium]|jgi:tRNA(Ile)-lysidine synthase|nr:tRNA lysidine(34) synthetase TilS [Eggerthellaceae bacterium]